MPGFIKDICEKLQEDTKKPVKFCEQINGGIINCAGLFEIGNKRVFVKYADRKNAYGMFKSEFESLKIIGATNTVQTPSPVKIYSITPEKSCFVQEYMDALTPVVNQWKELGEQVASLHRYNINALEKMKQAESSVHSKCDTASAQSKFGFHCTIYVGSEFEIPATWESDWLTFFARRKMQPQFEKIEKKTNDCEFRELWSELQTVIDIPFRKVTIKPSIIHGDFCTINVGEWKGQPVLYDPGCYYGHHEMDLIIPTMEKNFPPEFYQKYFEVLPKFHEDFEARQNLYQLYAFTMLCNTLNELELKRSALDIGKKLLSQIKSKKL